LILDAVGCCFALLRRVCWPALEECYESCLSRVRIGYLVFSWAGLK
jgi:hypothetical protein